MVKLADIVHNPDTYELNDVDFNSPEYLAWQKDIKESQEISQERKILDWKKIRALKFNI